MGSTSAKQISSEAPQYGKYPDSMRSSSGRQAIQARKSCCWRKLRICCGREGGLELTIRVPISSHNSVLLERFDSTASIFNGFPHQLFPAGFFERARENLTLGFGGD